MKASNDFSTYVTRNGDGPDWTYDSYLHVDSRQSAGKQRKAVVRVRFGWNSDGRDGSYRCSALHDRRVSSAEPESSAGTQPGDRRAPECADERLQVHRSQRSAAARRSTLQAPDRHSGDRGSGGFGSCGSCQHPRCPLAPFRSGEPAERGDRGHGYPRDDLKSRFVDVAGALSKSGPLVVDYTFRLAIGIVGLLTVLRQGLLAQL